MIKLKIGNKVVEYDKNSQKMNESVSSGEVMIESYDEFEEMLEFAQTHMVAEETGWNVREDLVLFEDENMATRFFIKCQLTGNVEDGAFI